MSTPRLRNSSASQMQPLYHAIACKEFEGKKILFPGYRPAPGQRELQPGDRIKLKKQDGDVVETTVKGILPCVFDLVMMEKTKLYVPSGFYFAIEVPSDFNCTGDVFYLDPGEKREHS